MEEVFTASAPAVNMLEQIRTLTDVGAMTRLLHECIAYERSIDNELEALLEERHGLEKKLGGLYQSAEVLEFVRSDAEQMLRSVSSTCDLADHVSGKVRELDLAQSRVQTTLARIDAIVDRTNCIDGVKQALEVEDYETAAKYVETFLQLDSEFHESAPGLGNAPGRETESEQRRQLFESKQKLEAIFRKKLAAAVESKDHDNVVRFVKLYPPLRLQEEGLRSYVAYLRKVVAMRARGDYEVLIEALGSTDGGRGAGTADFVGILNNIFKDIAFAVEENEDLLFDLAGEEGVALALVELQEECDARGSLIIKKYIEQRKLLKLTKDIAAHSKHDMNFDMNLLAVAAPPEGPDPREIEVCLEEMMLLSQTSEDYFHFMSTKMKEAGATSGQLSPRESNSFKAGSFGLSVQELVGYYIILEEYFMSENVKKAIQIDELVADGMTTSMVDDVFYVLQSCTRRAISTSSLLSVQQIINHTGSLLNNDFSEALQRKIREPSLFLKLFSQGVAVQKAGAEVSAALNNVDVSAEYVVKLKHDIEEHAFETLIAPGEREKVKSALRELEDIGNRYRHIGNQGLEQLANSIVPRLRNLLDVVGTVSYELTEAQYAENEVNDPWVQKLLHAVDVTVTWLQPLLTTSNYDSLVHLIIDTLVKRLEVLMMQKRFNQLGGLQLDRDARTLVGHFSAMTQRTVRDKFARLTQMATILNLERVSEILDYWGENSGPMTWRLTPTEVRRVLGLRVDFKPEVIDRKSVV